LTSLGSDINKEYLENMDINGLIQKFQKTSEKIIEEKEIELKSFIDDAVSAVIVDEKINQPGVVAVKAVEGMFTGNQTKSKLSDSKEKKLVQR
jgi:hypothetical protein